MKIVIAPDSFKEALSARRVCDAIARGVRRAMPHAVIETIPMADGGEGTVDALVAAADAANLEVVHHKESMGAFVDSVDGVENGEDGHWWSYYVNDEYGQLAADRADVDDGDEVRWVYMGSPFD